MKKLAGLIFSTALIGGLLSTTSCSDDPPIKPKLSFGESSIIVNEADDVIEIEVVLDRPALVDYTIDYEISDLSTAQDEETATNNTDDPDFVILEDLANYGEIEIAKGETSGIIQIKIYSDFYIEDDETIEIKILDVDSDQIEITRDDDIKVTIEQEDGLAILLDWESSSVDLDLLVRFGTTTNNWLGVLTGSLFGQPELAFIPNTWDDGAFGMSYTYYSGAVDPLNFTVDFIEIINGAAEAEAGWNSFNATYTLVNINEWQDVASTQVVQTFTKSGSNYSNFSNITVPGTGSRIIMQPIPSDPIRVKNFIGPRILKH